MKKLNKRVIVLALATFTLVAGTSVYASGAVSTIFPTVNSEHQDQAKKVEDRLTQSWNKGMDILQGSAEVKTFTSSDNSTDQDISNWTFIDSTKLNQLLSSFSTEEKSSFLEAFYGKERKENLEQGDYMSALLINPKKSKALVYWEKANGSYVVIEMNTNDDNSWYVSGVRVEPSK